jgi:hypothetical protein
VDVVKTLRTALGQLESEKARIERQMASIRLALKGAGSAGSSAGRRRGRSSMSPAARRAVSKRMKAYWAKRRAAAGKS